MMNQGNKKNIFDNLAAHFRDEEFILLESQMPQHPSSQRSFAAIRPKRWIRAEGNKIYIFDGSSIKRFVANPWDALKKFRNEKKSWLFGFFGYDLKNFTERLSSQNRTLINLPDLYFMEPEILLSVEDSNVKQINGTIAPNVIHSVKPGIFGSFEFDATRGIRKKYYIDKVRDIKERIAAGDFYELNFSYPISGNWKGDPYSLYQKMREINPVPFGAYIQTGTRAVCSISPERFLKKTGNSILSEPIKGTSERSENPETDHLLKLELSNEKNRAENLMIVDLVRHDLSKIAKTGSVQVKHLYDVQTFGTVHQLISAIEAEVENDTDAVDIIRECFPMGSMTGAPKIEVMKAIEEFENYKRGLYSGAIGYFTPDDDFDFNVVIRTAIIEGSRLIYSVGGAITSDSDPELEWRETKIKSRSLTNVFSKDATFTK